MRLWKKSYPDMQRNQRLFFANNIFSCIGLGLCGEGYVQTFLLSVGMDIDWIGWYGLVLNLAMLAAYAVFSVSRPRNGNYLSWMVRTCSLIVAYPLGFFLLSFFRLPSGMTRVLALGIGLVYSMSSAFGASSGFCLIPAIFDRESYGKLIGTSGVTGGIIAFLVSTVGAYLLRGASEAVSYQWFFGLAAAALSMCVALTMRYRPVYTTEEAPPAALPVRELLTRLSRKKYIKLLIPHSLRGIGAAGMYYYIAAAFNASSITPAQSTVIAVLSVFSGVVGNLLFVRLISRVRSGILVFWANAVCAVCMILVTFKMNSYAALGLYLIFGSASAISATGIPVGVMRSTGNEDIAFISAMRMFAYSSMSCVFIPVFGYWISVSAISAMVVAGVIYVFAGIGYRYQLRDMME